VTSFSDKKFSDIIHLPQSLKDGTVQVQNCLAYVATEVGLLS